MSLDLFKQFARSHPELATSVMNNKTSWQKLYELYEIYGENSQIWDSYTSSRSFVNKVKSTSSSFKDLFNAVKNIDLDSIQKGVTNLQKTIGLLQDIGLTNTKPAVSNYEPRPMYKYFEDWYGFIYN